MDSHVIARSLVYRIRTSLVFFLVPASSLDPLPTGRGLIALHNSCLLMGSAKNENIYYSLDKGPLEDENSAILKTVKAATSGLVAGTIWGTVVATWNDVPRVERHVALPGLIRTLKICGNYGLTFAAIGGIYIGVEQLVLKQRVKKDFINGAVGAFVAGASVYGLKGKTIPSALSAGSALAVTSAILDIGGQTTRVDVGKEYYPYTTEKRPSPSVN